MTTEGIIGSRTLSGQNFMGLRANITIPWTYGSPNVGPDAENYFDFYFGMQSHDYDSTDTEAGIFYYNKKGWVIFLNICAWNAAYGGPYVWEEQSVSVTPGQTYSMELRNNGDNSVTFYWDGTAIWTKSAPTGFADRIPTGGGWFSMNHGKVDETGSMFYTGAYFSNPQLRLTSGSYSNWTASSWGYASKNSGDIADFTINSQFPVSTNLA
jgi:hypothetical protein